MLDIEFYISEKFWFSARFITVKSVGFFFLYILLAKTTFLEKFRVFFKFAGRRYIEADYINGGVDGLSNVPYSLRGLEHASSLLQSGKYCHRLVMLRAGPRGSGAHCELAQAGSNAVASPWILEWGGRGHDLKT